MTDRFTRRTIVNQTIASLVGLLALLSTLPAAAASADVCAPEPQAALLETPGLPVSWSLPAAAPRLVEHGSRDQKLVALTFDACTTSEKSPYDPRIEKILAATRTPATVFIGGAWARKEAAQLEGLARLPLVELGNHTWSHPHLVGAKDEVIAEELVRTQAQVLALTGQLPTLFRPPYGEYDDHLVRVAARYGLTTIEFDLASGDPDARFTKERLLSSVLSRVHAGSIVVMHINHKEFHTAEALPEIIATLRARGYELVTVSQMLEREHTLELALGDAASCRPPSGTLAFVESPLLPVDDDALEDGAHTREHEAAREVFAPMVAALAGAPDDARRRKAARS
jgi:peptidoglycan-N-acetylglucosamine deacetylase